MQALGRSLQKHSLGRLPDGGCSPLQLFVCLLHGDHNPDAEEDKAQGRGVKRLCSGVFRLCRKPFYLLLFSSRRRREQLWQGSAACRPNTRFSVAIPTPLYQVQVFCSGEATEAETRPSPRSPTLNSPGPKVSTARTRDRPRAPINNSSGNTDAYFRR